MTDNHQDQTTEKKGEVEAEINACEYDKSMQALYVFRLSPVCVASSRKEMRTLEEKMKLFAQYVKFVPDRISRPSPESTPLEIYASSGFDGSVLVSPQLRELSLVHIYTGHSQAPPTNVDVWYNKSGAIVKIRDTTFYLSPFLFGMRKGEERKPMNYGVFGLNPAEYSPIKAVLTTIGSSQHRLEAETQWKEIEPHVQLGRRRNQHGGIDSIMSSIINLDGKDVSFWPREHPIDVVYITTKRRKGEEYVPLRIRIDHNCIGIANLTNGKRYDIYLEPTYFGERVHWQSL